jgi:predicted LPLAT superfamily acyltransferase
MIPATRWQEAAEKGSVLGIRIVVVLATALGRAAVSPLLHLVAAWYVAFHPAVRRASRAYLVRLRGRASLADVYRHVLCFARVTADRIFLSREVLAPFALATHGEEHLRALRDARRGALIVLAHVGSFEVLRAAGSARDVPVSFLGYFRNARMINAALRELNPAVDARLIEIRPDDPTFIFDVERLVADGELVGTMGDRVGEDGKAVRATFLGAKASFPTGPYLLAAALGCPMYLAFGIYEEPNRYTLYCEPFAERVVLPRAGRQEALAAYAARYAARVEHYCRLAPYNWFNFFDFWSAR